MDGFAHEAVVFLAYRTVENLTGDAVIETEALTVCSETMEALVTVLCLS